MLSFAVRQSGRMLVVAMVLAGFATLTPAVHAGDQQVSSEEQKGRDFINRHAMGIHNWAHTGAKYTSMIYSRTERNFNGFTLVYQHDWVSSLTGNKNSTTWNFQFSKNGKFQNYSYKTTWPTGAFEIVDLSIAAVRQALLNDPNINDRRYGN